MATPKDLTYIRGTKDTADVASIEKVIEVGNQIYMYDPNSNQALRSALRNGKTESTPQHIFYEQLDAPFPHWVEYAGAVESVQAATGIVLKTGHGARVTLGSRIYWTRTEEITRLDAVMSTDTTGAVSRNFGRGTAAASLLKPGDKGLIMTPAFDEGFTTGLGLSNSMTSVTRYTTIISLPVQVTNTENAETARAGNPFKRALKKTIKQGKDMMEGELLFSGYKVDSSSYTHPLTTSEGLANLISTNVYSMQYATRMDLWDVLAEYRGRRFGGSFWCSGPFYAQITEMAINHAVMDMSDTVYGMSIESILTPYGRYELDHVDLFDEDPYLVGNVFIVPNGHITYRPLVGTENLDVRYRPIYRDEVHAKEGELYGEYGWAYGPEEDYLRISGLRFTA